MVARPSGPSGPHRLQRGRAAEAARAEVRAGGDRRGSGIHHRPAASVYGVLKPAVADYRGTIVLTGTPGNLIKGLFFDVTNGREAGWSGHRWGHVREPVHEGAGDRGDRGVEGGQSSSGGDALVPADVP